MSTAAGFGLSLWSLSRPITFVWHAWRHITAMQVRYAVVFWLAWGLTVGLQMMAGYPAYAWWIPIVTGLYDALLVALLLLLGIAIADACAPGAWPWLPYAIVAVVADVLGSILIVKTEPWVGIQCCWDGARPSDWIFIAAGLGTNFVVCALTAFSYYHRRRTLQRVSALQHAQLRRAELARRTFETRLQAMQARVEPQLLFNTLSHVERLYQVDTTMADRMLDDLIVYLRAALPHLRETTSTVAREIDLVRAYFNIARAQLADRLTLHAADSHGGSDARFPPMILLPLIEQAILARLESPLTAGSIGIDWRVTGDKLRLTVTDEGGSAVETPAGAIPIASIRERLTALYGAAASLSLHRTPGRITRTVVEIPYERFDDRAHC
jgi:Histidine kinase